MRERRIEKYLIDRIENLGGQAVKLNTGKRGMPDRMILLPGGRIFFIELKAPGKKTTPLQNKRIRDLNKLGFKAGVLDSRVAIERFIEEVIQ